MFQDLSRNFRLAVVMVFLCMIPRAAISADPALHVELNSTAAVGDACRVTFLVQNKLGSPVGALKLELVLFDTDGQVNQLLTVNLGRMPLGKTRVKQFDLKGLTCPQIGRLLLNNIAECKGENLTPAVCTDAVKTTSRVSVAFSY